MGYLCRFVDGDLVTSFVVAMVTTAVDKLLEQLSHDFAVDVEGGKGAVVVHTIAVDFGMRSDVDDDLQGRFEHIEY